MIDFKNINKYQLYYHIVDIYLFNPDNTFLYINDKLPTQIKNILDQIKFHKMTMIWNYVDKQIQKIDYPNFRHSIFHDTIQQENREIIERIYYKAEWGDKMSLTLKNFKDNKKKYFL